MENNNKIIVTLLGTGTSGGVPIITCECPVCTSNNLKDQRLRASILIKIKDKNIVIDVGPDFRSQMLKTRIKKLDAIFLTHEHRDHTSGLDDIRAFNNLSKTSIPIFAQKHVLEDVKLQFPYAFGELAYRGGPRMDLKAIKKDYFIYENQKITIINALHGNITVVGFRINNFAYLTDFNRIAIEEKKKLENLDVLVIGTLRRTKHVSHLSLNEALELVAELKPKKAYLTHIGHLLGLHDELDRELPDNISPGYDGFEITL